MLLLCAELAMVFDLSVQCLNTDLVCTGQVYLWDQRGGSAPRAKLGKGSNHSVTSLQLSQDSHLLLASTSSGEVSVIGLCGMLHCAAA